MTDNNALEDDDIKDYVFCDVCSFHGYPYEKVVFRCTGFRSEDEDGFAYKYDINEFENSDRIHIHRSGGTSYLQQHHVSPDQDRNLKEQFDNESCEIWADYSDHSFTDAITFIDMLPELFPRIFNKLQEFVN